MPLILQLLRPASTSQPSTLSALVVLLWSPPPLLGSRSIKKTVNSFLDEKFHVELAVDDGKDNVTFVVFDKEMTNLTKYEDAALALEEIANGGEEELP
ncbi:hypothetical protein F2Q69_00020151 [Brassica cretica]|uniref:Replication factor A C-terminal domain-containing protein n=1 Tax=Brassica cretica TaxID=69181 RepID=A0A8S9QHC7_BRACR|nr:hypothetical protein F2Q69_00020151 [Brassica cretica]